MPKVSYIGSLPYFLLNAQFKSNISYFIKRILFYDNKEMNFNIYVILGIILVPVCFLLKKLIEFLLTKKKRDQVRKLLEREPAKRIQTVPSGNLKVMGDLMSPKYFVNIFYKEYLNVVRYNLGETISLQKWLGFDDSKMESNYYFNLSKNKMASSMLMRNTVNKKRWNNFIIPEMYKTLINDPKEGYLKNILDVEFIFVGDSIKLPTWYSPNDTFIFMLKGSLDINYLPPAMISELDPYICFQTTRKRIDDIESDKIGRYTLREGDFAYIPNCYVYELNFEESFPTQIVCKIEIDNFQRTGKVDRETDLIKLEQMQMRKIPQKVYPKNLEKDELEILWKKNIINGTIWEKNQLIPNIILKK
jgi:hypothetical protein